MTTHPKLTYVSEHAALRLLDRWPMSGEKGKRPRTLEEARAWIESAWERAEPEGKLPWRIALHLTKRMLLHPGATFWRVGAWRFVFKEDGAVASIELWHPDLNMKAERAR